MAKKGVKHDQEKTQFHLVPNSYIEGTARVFMFGASKYGKWNWTKGLSYTRLIDAAWRHISAFRNGENKDPETGMNHLYHASCNLAMLSVLLKTYKRGDDRHDNSTKGASRFNKKTRCNKRKENREHNNTSSKLVDE